MACSPSAPAHAGCQNPGERHESRHSYDVLRRGSYGFARGRSPLDDGRCSGVCRNGIQANKPGFGPSAFRGFFRTLTWSTHGASLRVQRLRSGSRTTGLDFRRSTLFPAPVRRSKVPLTVTINPATGAASAAPTGQVFNTTSGFNIGGQKAIFLFASEDGAISGWNPAFGSGSTAVVAVDHGNPNPSLNAVYKGLAISTVNGGTLYATNFRAGTVEAYDSNFNAPTLVGRLRGPEPSGRLRAVQRQGHRGRRSGRAFCHLCPAGRRQT